MRRPCFQRLRFAALGIIALALAGSPVTADCGCGHVPDAYAHELKKWPARDRHAGAPAPVRLESHAHTRALTEQRGATLGEAMSRYIREEVARGANFAGAYRLIRDECRDCTSLLVVSLRSGQVYRLHLSDIRGTVYFDRASDLIVLVSNTRTPSGENHTTTQYFTFVGGEFHRVEARS